MANERTKGPWIFDNDADSPQIVADEGKRWNNPVICSLFEDVTPEDSVTFGAWHESYKNHRANARLIAAAPELLAALEECAERMEQLQKVTNYPLAWPRELAAAAIAKAKGANNVTE